MGIAARFAVHMGIWVAVVAAGAGLALVWMNGQAVDQGVREFGVDALRWVEAGSPAPAPDSFTVLRGTEIYEAPVAFEGAADTEPALVWRPMRMSDTDAGGAGRPSVAVPLRRLQDLTGNLVVLVGVVVLALAAVSLGVAFRVGKAVAAPLDGIMGDLSRISRGDLDRPTRSGESGVGEIAILGRAVERMRMALGAAREKEAEAGRRQHEVAVAAEIREALLPSELPQPDGYSVAAFLAESPEIGGALYDVAEGPGRLDCLVTGVAGIGMPAALVGSSARAVLRQELERAADPLEAFFAANRAVSRDMRSGMFVTALLVRLEPASGAMTIISAGHEVPLIRLGPDGRGSLVSCEGFALGFDEGPVFEKTLEARALFLEPGDRVVLATTGALEAENPDGEALGEMRFLAACRKEALGDGNGGGLRAILSRWTGPEGQMDDAAVVTLTRLPS